MDESGSSHHSLVSPFADHKLMFRSNLLQRRLHRSKRYDQSNAEATSTESCAGTADESTDHEIGVVDKPRSAPITAIARIRRASSTQSEPEKTSSQAPHRHPKVERSVSSFSYQQMNNPSIIIMPATPRPSMMKGMISTEYTSITDDLENQACFVAHLSLPSAESPTLTAKRPHISRHGSSEVEEAAQAMTEILHDAELTDYHLMEGLIQRRLHQDSEHITESMEDLCHLDSDNNHSDDRANDADNDSDDEYVAASSSPKDQKTVFYLSESQC